MFNRRDFLSASTQLGSWHGLAALAALEAAASPVASAQIATGDTVADPTTYDFWSQDIRSPESSLTRGDAPPLQASFVWFDSNQDAFLAGSDIGDDDLPPEGDADVLLTVERFRPSGPDRNRFEDLQGGSLRIDLQQTEPLPGIAEQLAWTAIAGLLLDGKQLPGLRDMSFDPGATWGNLQSVRLPGGGGRWTWNFFLQKRKSRWMRIFETVKRSATTALPMLGLGLPAIALTALRTVDTIVAEITKDELTEWLFQSRDLYVYATAEAGDKIHGPKLPLKQGSYVLLPFSHMGALGRDADRLTLKDGLIVPKGTNSLQVFDAAQEVLPDVTYISVAVTVPQQQGRIPGPAGRNGSRCCVDTPPNG